MAVVGDLNPKHEPFVQRLASELQDAGFVVVEWGLEKVAPEIRKQSGINRDFSLSALRLRAKFDLLVRHTKFDFMCEIDAKTTMYRMDTGNVAVEVWPILFGLESYIPRLVVFEDVMSWGLWLDRLDNEWFRRYLISDRWNFDMRERFDKDIRNLLAKKEFSLLWGRKIIHWYSQTSSGDPFFLWKQENVITEGLPYREAIHRRMSEESVK